MTATQSLFNQGYKLGAPGDIADSGNYDQISGAAGEAMPNGGYFVVETATEDVFRLPRLNSLGVAFSGDTTSGPVTTTIRTVALDGTIENTAISTAFDTNHATTMAALLVDLNAIDDLTAILSDQSGAKRNVLITVAGDKSVETYVNFAHASLTFIETYSSIDSIAGISRRDCTVERATDGTTTLALGDDLGVVRQGRVFMFAEQAIAKSDTLYTRYSAGTAAGEELGNLRSSAGSGPTVAFAVPGNISLHKSAALGDIAVVELGLQGS